MDKLARWMGGVEWSGRSMKGILLCCNCCFTFIGGGLSSKMLFAVYSFHYFVVVLRLLEVYFVLIILWFASSPFFL